MTNRTAVSLSLLGAALALVGPAAAQQLVTNGGFEAGFTGWTRANQVGSTGNFLDQTGTGSPLTGQVVQPPPQGLHAAMTDGAGPGAHVLYQDIVIPGSVPGASIQFSLFIHNTATAFTTPATLDFATPALNQQARVDQLSAAADPFSVAGGDIFQNLFQTLVGSPLVTGYNPFNIDITAALAAHAGQTVRLRFAETDNVNIFNLGVDGVSVLVVPAPAGALLALPLVFLGARPRRRPGDR
jgi:hypothetical protein